jgi:hypothetical protein
MKFVFLFSKMEVRPKRNKFFTCDQCGEEIDTKGDYDKIISVHFSEGRKFRNKFCSLDCFEKWKLLNKKANDNKAPLEDAIKKITDSEKEAYKEEEEPDKEYVVPKNKSKDIKYKENTSMDYKKEDKKNKDNADVKETRADVECINWTDSKGVDIVKYPGRYDKQGSLQKAPKYAPKDNIKKFLDYFNVLRTKHNKDKYK